MHENMHLIKPSSALRMEDLEGCPNLSQIDRFYICHCFHLSYTSDTGWTFKCIYELFLSVNYLLMSFGPFSIRVFIKAQFVRAVLGIDPLQIILVANIFIFTSSCAVCLYFNLKNFHSFFAFKLINFVICNCFFFLPNSFKLKKSFYPSWDKLNIFVYFLVFFEIFSFFFSL